MNKTSQQHPEGCSCGMCSSHHGCCCGHHGRYIWLRWLLGILILVIVFWVGVKVGEFKGGAYGWGYQSYGSHRMMNYNPMMMHGQGMPNMMYRTGSAPTASPTPTPAK